MASVSLRPFQKLNFATDSHVRKPSSSSLTFSGDSLQRAQRSRVQFSGKQIWPTSVVTATAADRADSPQRPVVILPGLGNNTADYKKLAEDLAETGLASEIAQVSRPDWLRNAAGLLDSNYWRGTLKPRPVLDWYLQRIERAVAEAKAKAPDGTKISLVAHSAGGWLARLFLSEHGTDDVALLLTLGSPHLPPPRGVPGVVDQTRGLLYYIDDTCPGAYHPEVKYVCLAGRYLKGQPLFGKPSAEVAPIRGGQVAAEALEPAVTAFAAIESASLAGTGGGGPAMDSPLITAAPPTMQARIVGQGYKQVCGQAEVWGDGVVPEISAHLEGALNVSIDGVYHSPVGANSERPWYGSPGVLEQWVHHLLE